jgi:hypothetical protein
LDEESRKIEWLRTNCQNKSLGSVEELEQCEIENAYAEITNIILEESVVGQASNSGRTNRTDAKSVAKRQIGILLGLAAMPLASWYFGSSDSKNFKTLFSRDEDMTQHITNVENSLNVDHATIYQVTKVLDEFPHHVEDLIRKAETRIGTELGKTNGELNMVVKRISLLRKAAEVHRQVSNLETIVSDCRNGHIPHTLLGPHYLKKNLNSLDAMLKADGRTLALGTADMGNWFKLKVSQIQFLSSYVYSLCMHIIHAQFFSTFQIVDCMFSVQRILITIQVPIKTIGNDWKLFKVHATDFRYLRSTCVVVNSPSYIAVAGEKIISLTEEQKQTCSPETNLICKVSVIERNTHSKTTCARAILHQTTVKDLNRDCQMDCIETNQSSIAQFEDTNTFLLTNVPNLTVTCPKKDPVTYENKDFHLGKNMHNCIYKLRITF